MNDETFIKVEFPLEDSKLIVEESGFGDYLDILYQEGGGIEGRLPTLTKKQWEKLKRAGDYVFGEME